MRLSKEDGGYLLESVWKPAIAQALAEARAEAAKPLMEVCERLITQFKVIQMHQHRLLVRGQDLESASKNWEEATEGMSLDFEPLMQEVEKLKHSLTGEEGK